LRAVSQLGAIFLFRLPLYVANEMVENVLGTTQLPFAVATNFVVNGRDVVVPMAVEEPSVVAAASFGAKLARASGGFRATAPPPLMLGQVLLVGLADGRLEAAQRAILDAERRLIDLANSLHPSLKARGGGVQRVEPRALSTWRGPMLVVHVHVDVRDSMGANTVTTICEKLAPHLEELTGAVSRMRILSNLCPDRVFTAEAVWTKQELAASVKNLGLTGDEVVEAMLDASAFAEADEFRACTHNKGTQKTRQKCSRITERAIIRKVTVYAFSVVAGVMNGIDAVAMATMNDCRAIEAGAHAFAGTATDHYSPLTRYEKTPEGDLRGIIHVPLALGVRGMHSACSVPMWCTACGLMVTCVAPLSWSDFGHAGGAIGSHPLARLALKMMHVDTSDELGMVMAAVGLAQNFAAMRALVTEGLCRGHMRLHAKNIAIQAGAPPHLIAKVAETISDEKAVTLERAKHVLAALLAA